MWLKWSVSRGSFKTQNYPLMLILAIFIHYKLQCATNYITTIILIHKTTSEQKPSSSPRWTKSNRGQKKVSLDQVCSLWAPPHTGPRLPDHRGFSASTSLVLSPTVSATRRSARRGVSIGVIVADSLGLTVRASSIQA